MLAALEAPPTDASDLISVVLTNKWDKAAPRDIMEGDRDDGYRLSRVRINGGRRWKQWLLPVAVLRLERRGEK